MDRWSTMTFFQRRLAGEIFAYEGVRNMARAYRINPGIISRVMNGGDSPTLRNKLDVPPPTRTIPSCPDCGEVHTQHKTCDTERVGRERKRFSGDTPLADVIAAEARRFGLTNGEMLESLWRGYEMNKILYFEGGPLSKDDNDDPYDDAYAEAMEAAKKEQPVSVSPGQAYVRCPVCHENADWQDGYYCKNETCPNFVGAKEQPNDNP